jgi:pimeloyl-ACP methyl ester carboxylesterase
MASCVLVPGADGSARYWFRVEPELRRLGHEVIAVDLPISDPHVGLTELAEVIAEAIGPRSDVLLVAQSLAGFIGPMVCKRRRIELLVLLNAMVPAPHETAGDWWAATRHAEARAAYGEFDLVRDFFHDVPPEITAEALASPIRGPSDAVFSEPWPLERWPDVPTRFLQGRDDRFFPLDFQRRVVKERLGVCVDEMPGGHLVALSQPCELAQRLDRYWATRAA